MVLQALLSTLAGFLFVVTALLHVADPETHTIGRDPGVTLTFSFAATLWWESSLTSLFVFLRVQSLNLRMKGEERR